jgi:hypothetical protein
LLLASHLDVDPIASFDLPESVKIIAACSGRQSAAIDWRDGGAMRPACYHPGGDVASAIPKRQSTRRSMNRCIKWGLIVTAVGLREE